MEKVITPVNIEKRKKLDLRPGDTVRVHQKIEEKGKTRLQAFEGLVLARKHGTEAGATFTVRRNTGGYGVEKIFPLYSPMIDKIEITKRSKVRRSKLYYIRRKALKQISKRMKMMFVDIREEEDEPKKEDETNEETNEETPKEEVKAEADTQTDKQEEKTEEKTDDAQEESTEKAPEKEEEPKEEETPEKAPKKEEKKEE